MREPNRLDLRQAGMAGWMCTIELHILVSGLATHAFCRLFRLFENAPEIGSQTSRCNAHARMYHT